MTDKACAFCVKRSPTADGRLECRARPPVSDGVLGRFPIVHPLAYCWSDFELDSAAKKTLEADRAETARLDALTAATAERAAAPEPAPTEPEPVDGAGGAKRRRKSEAAQDKLL